MNHNLPPAAPQEQLDPNILNGPNTIIAIPEENRPWETEDPDRLELQRILDASRELAENAYNSQNAKKVRDAQAALEEAESLKDPDLITSNKEFLRRAVSTNSLGQRMHAKKRKENQTAFLNLIKRGNPSAILATLDRELQASTNQITGAEKEAVSARAAASQSEATHTKEKLSYTTASRHNAVNPANGEKATEVKRELRTRSSKLADASIAAGDSERHAKSKERHLRYNSDYPDEIKSLIEIAESVYGQNWGEMQRLNHDISMDLRRWDITAGPDSPTLPDQVQDKLKDFRSNIDALPRSDARRAEGLADHNRLLYRFMSRVIREETVSGQQQRSAEFMRSGGIRLTSEPTVIFADGSVERQDQSTGEWVRRTPDGQIWNPVRKELDPQAEGPRNWRVALAKWEESRTHHDAQEAYASLSAHARQLEAGENRLMARLTPLEEEMRTNNNLLANLRNTDTSGMSDVEKQNAQNVIATLTGRNNQLSANIQIITNDLEPLRAELNPVRYWRGFLEIDTERREPEARQRQRGRLLVRRKVQLEPDAQPWVPPTINPDGTLVFDQATINGRTIPSDAERQAAAMNTAPLPQWQISPDGSAVHYEISQGRMVYYDPAGRVISR